MDAVLNTAVPCYGEEGEKMVLSEAKLRGLGFDSDNGTFITKCKPASWRSSSKDERYHTAGTISLYSYLEQNGLYDDLK